MVTGTDAPLVEFVYNSPNVGSELVTIATSGVPPTRITCGVSIADKSVVGTPTRTMKGSAGSLTFSESTSCSTCTPGCTMSTTRMPLVKLGADATMFALATVFSTPWTKNDTWVAKLGRNTSKKALPAVPKAGETSATDGALLSMRTVTPPWAGIPTNAE
jgi:hypothetical protein